MYKNEQIINDDEIELEGFITYYKYENENNGYRIASFKIDDNKQERSIIIVGSFPHFAKTDALKLKGKVVHHKKYGLQVEVHEINLKLPTGRENIIRFLSSSKFKGIGKKCATSIYEFIQDDVVSTLFNDESIYEKMLLERIITEKQKESLKLGLKDFNFNTSYYQLLMI